MSNESQDIVEKTAIILDEILEKTIEGKIDWEYSQVQDSVNCNIYDFNLVIKRNKVSMITSFKINVFDGRTSLLDVNDKDLRKFDPEESSGYDDYWQLLSNLFDMARNKALGINSKIENLIENIKKL